MLLEWAPHDTPQRDPYPYRNTQFVDLHEHDERESGRRRLHNLGFSRRRTLDGNVRDYQAAFGQAVQSGDLRDIALELEHYHDEGGLVQETDSLAFDDPAPRDEPGRASPTKPSGTGQKNPLPPTVVDVQANPHLVGHFEFARISSTARGKKDRKSYEAHFWVMTDAFKWIVPSTCSPQVDQWCEAITLYTFSEDVMVPGKRTWRLPTHALDATRWCQLVTHHQGSAIFHDAEAELSSGTSNSFQICVLPTPKLFRLRYLAPGALQIPALHGPHGNLAKVSDAFNKRVSDNAKAQWGSKSGRPRILADPAKIWAIDHLMDKPNFIVDRQRVKRPNPGPCKVGFEPTSKAAINYGFHRKDGTAIQTPANCHGKRQIDYSQLLVAVAGWCEIREEEGTWQFMRTADIYTDPNLFPLAVIGSVPLRKTAYELP